MFARKITCAVVALRFENLLARNSSLKIFKHDKEEKLAGPKGNLAGPAPFLVAEGLGPALNAKTFVYHSHFFFNLAVVKWKWQMKKISNVSHFDWRNLKSFREECCTFGLNVVILAWTESTQVIAKTSSRWMDGQTHRCSQQQEGQNWLLINKELKISTFKQSRKCRGSGHNQGGPLSLIE